MQEWYANLNERERRLVLIGGGVALVLAILAIVLPLNRNIAQARQRVANKQADLAFIQDATPQMLAAGPSGGTVANADSLVVLVDRSARESGLGKALSSSQPTGDKGLRVRFDRAPFDALVAWLGRLSQQNGVRIESAEIEYAGETGLVNAGLVLKGG
jgi:general secretion pathway protein M